MFLIPWCHFKILPSLSVSVKGTKKRIFYYHVTLNWQMRICLSFAWKSYLEIIYVSYLIHMLKNANLLSRRLFTMELKIVWFKIQAWWCVTKAKLKHYWNIKGQFILHKCQYAFHVIVRILLINPSSVMCFLSKSEAYRQVTLYFK